MGVRKRPPARTPEERENQLIAQAFDLAEKKMQDGTASSTLITYVLKLGNEKEKLERDILASQRKLMDAKTENLASSKRIEELYNNAISAMKHYNGSDRNEESNQDIF